MKLQLSEANISHFASCILIYINEVSRNHSVLHNSKMAGRGSISSFIECYVCNYLHYGFKTSMLLTYNLLLVITLITYQLNIYVFKRHDFIPCFFAKKVFVFIEKLTSGSYFQMSTKNSITARKQML